MKIIQIVPGAPPQVNGVGDYALRCTIALRSIGVDSSLLVCNRDWKPAPVATGVRMIAHPGRDTDELAQALEKICAEDASRSTVLLQLSPYGYSHHGAPFWLLRALRRWKASNPTRRLIVYFHELYGAGPPWTRAFWLSPLQRRCAAGFARLADRSLTSMHRYACTLGQWNGGSAPQALAVPSNVGELGACRPLVSRERQLVVFGSAGLRTRAYRQSGDLIANACRLLGIRSVVDIGHGEPPGLEDLRVEDVRRLGPMAAEDVGRALEGSCFGYLDYYPGYLAKSGIFAAYCAHGMTPVSPHANDAPEDGIVAGRAYWHPGLGDLTTEAAQGIAHRAFAWYRDHTVSTHADALARAARAS